MSDSVKRREGCGGAAVGLGDCEGGWPGRAAAVFFGHQCRPSQGSTARVSADGSPRARARINQPGSRSSFIATSRIGKACGVSRISAIACRLDAVSSAGDITGSVMMRTGADEHSDDLAGAYRRRCVRMQSLQEPAKPILDRWLRHAVLVAGRVARRD